MFRFASAWFVRTLALALVFGCGGEKLNPAGDYKTPGAGGSTGTGGSGGAGGSTPTGVSYAQTIAPMLAASCAISGCHAGSNPVSGIGLDTYDKASANASAANDAIQNGVMPLDPGVALTSADKQSFQDWVNAGAPNN